MAMESGYTLTSLARDIARVEQALPGKASRREMDDVKSDMNKLEDKLDRIIQTQLANQRTAIWQLVAIVVTLVVAGYGALR